MPSSSKSRVLTDRDEIRQWAKERDARPTCVRGTGGNEDVGIIRLDFPGFSGEGSLEEIGWDEWFDKFERSGLVLLVQDETAGGQRSNFNKLVSRETVESGAENRSSARRSQRRSRSTGQNRGRASRSGQKRRTRASSGQGRRSSSKGATGKRAATSGRNSRGASTRSRRTVGTRNLQKKASSSVRGREAGSGKGRSSGRGGSSRRRAA